MKPINVCWLSTNLDLAIFTNKITKYIDDKGINSFHITHSKLTQAYFKKRNIPVEFISCKQDWNFSFDEIQKLEKKYGIPNLRLIYFADLFIRIKNFKEKKANNITAKHLLFFEKYYPNNKIDFVILRPMSSIMEMAAYVVAKKMNIPFFIVDIGPYEGQTSLSDMNEQNIWSELYGEYKKLKKRNLTKSEKKQVYDFLDTFKNRHKMRVYFDEPTFKINILFKFIKKLFQKHDSEYNSLTYVSKRDFFKIFRSAIEKLLGFYKKPNFKEKYIFYALHFADDAQIVSRCPFYYNQIELIKQIALSMPAGYKLYTKEHPDETGVIPISKLKELNKVNNIKLLHPRTNSHDIIKNAQAVIVVSSTVGWEAVLYKIPVIVMAPIYYDLSELVYKVKDIRDLPQAVKEVLEKRELIYKNTAEWERLISAILKTTNKINIFEYYRGIKNIREEMAEKTADVYFKKIMKEVKKSRQV